MASFAAPGGQVFAAGPYRVLLFEPSPGVRLIYGIHDDAIPTGIAGYRDVDAGTLQSIIGSGIQAGNTLELTQMATDYGSFQAFWDNLLDRTLGKNNPARSSPEVLKVIAQFAARPDMSADELQGLLRSTQYYQTQTNQQREWNDLPAAEQNLRIQDMTARIGDEFFKLTGQQASPEDVDIANYARAIASGQRTYEGVIETWLKPLALRTPESPWARTVRAEQENQRRRPFEIEQKQGELRGLLSRWGVKLDDVELSKWASDIVQMKRSEDDMLEYVKDVAAVLYPWKDREMETQTAAQPWIQTYARVMEKPADLSNGQVQAALQQGLPAFEFELQLKQSSEWESTSNFNDVMTQSLGDISRRMGFS